jgi:7,8-dihydro-6-hydroxymethylpterin-pyrophosphokinase
LLLMEDISLKTPELTLPQPELHLRPEELVPASEVWGSYHHPILKRTLADVALGLTDKTWGDFYCQGPELLATT